MGCADIKSKLLHDIESNPGPCSQGPCPGASTLGFHAGLHCSSNKKDPFERLLEGSTYTFGGSDRYAMKLNEAIKEFIAREHPDVGQQRLKIVPSFPSVEGNIT